MHAMNRALASILALSLAVAGVPVPAAHAEVVPTDRTESAVAAPTGRERIDAMLAREEVRAELERRGVDPAEVSARVAALSDEEIDELAGRLDALPAGQEILEIAFGVFLILLVTDILGFTKVFSFTRPAK